MALSGAWPGLAGRGGAGNGAWAPAGEATAAGGQAGRGGDRGGSGAEPRRLRGCGAAGLRGGGSGACGLHGASGVRLSSGGGSGRGFSSPWETCCPHTWMTRDASTSQVRTAQRHAGLGFHGAPRATPPSSRGRGGGPGESRPGAGREPVRPLPFLRTCSLSAWAALPGLNMCSLPPLRSLRPHFSAGTCSSWSLIRPEPCTYTVDRVTAGSHPHLPSNIPSLPTTPDSATLSQSFLTSPRSRPVPPLPGFSPRTRG